MRRNPVMDALARAIPLKRGLRRRILAWFLILSLLPLFLSNSVGYRVTRGIIEGQMWRYLTALTEVQAQHVATEVERHQLYLQAVADDGFLAANLRPAAAAVRAGDRRAPAVTALHEHLDRQLIELDPLSELFVVDTAGRVIAATRHARVGMSWAESDLFRRARHGLFFAEDWDVQQGRLGPVYLLATPINDPEGRWIGLLAATVGFDRLPAFLRIPPHLAGDIHAYIVDAQGRPLFVSHPHGPLDYAAPLASPLARQAAGAMARYVNYEGVEVLGSTVAIPGISWRYLSEISVASAFGQLRTLALLAAGLEAAFALVLVGVVWIVARSIVAPLRRLVGAAERIREGDLGVEVQIDGPDELGDLNRTFNQMSRQLRASTARIQELHDQEMRRAAQLASVGELASGIAHEIKNPLVGMSSGLNLLEGRLGNEQGTRDILREIRAQHHRIEGAIRDLLSYARPKDPHLVSVDPEQLLDRVIPLVRPQALAAGVRLEHQPSGAMPRVRVDTGLMTQALVNLSLNGIQAMQPGGVLTLAARHVDHTVRIAVSDTGEGIPADRHETIFRPFFTTKHRGTGLGLTITRGIVERHGGRLEVESRPGAGSTFTLVLTSAP
ncbi:MAG TPA: ATP-binding protein [Gemmatimonadales bacterium]|nr:ATP-binding protein [Gemmatimonadales bacterium]